jgi:hypothetical protein
VEWYKGKLKYWENKTGDVLCCTYDVTFRAVRATIVAVEKQ